MTGKGPLSLYFVTPFKDRIGHNPEDDIADGNGDSTELHVAIAIAG